MNNIKELLNYLKLNYILQGETAFVRALLYPRIQPCPILRALRAVQLYHGKTKVLLPSRQLRGLGVRGYLG